MSAPHAVVVGGGVIGAAAAHSLSQAGWQVTILERSRFGSGCSHANCGLICPSHVLPMAAPGAIWNVLKTMFKPRSPVRLKPRVDFALWRWLLRFALRSNERDMLAAAAGIKALLDSSRSLFVDLIRDEKMDVEWEENGLLVVFQSKGPFEHFAATNDLLTERFAAPARRMEGDELTAFEPTLKSGLAGGWHYESDAQLRPDRLMSAWKEVLQRRGVRILEDHDVRDVVREGRRVKAVRTNHGDFDADAVVLAVGAWTPTMSSILGATLPIQPGKGYSLTIDRPRECPRVPMIFEEHRVALTPFPSGLRLGSMMEFNGYDAEMNRDRLVILREGAAPYMRLALEGEAREEWWGWRPMSVDGNPFIDRAPSCDNLWVAAGHSMLGLSQAPATGKLLAELMTDSVPHIDPAPYRIGR
jgi:D-amino-acid dehydrogenase